MTLSVTIEQVGGVYRNIMTETSIKKDKIFLKKQKEHERKALALRNNLKLRKEQLHKQRSSQDVTEK